MKLFSVAEMISLEKEANASGLTYPEMMENAGKGISDEVENNFGRSTNKKIFALVGPGNNGGDALVSLAILANHGWETSAYLVKNRDINDPLVNRFLENHGKVISRESDPDYSILKELFHSNLVMLDGILGTGIKLPLKGEIAEVLAVVKQEVVDGRSNTHVVAVDCPSGVDCDSGEIAQQTIPAEFTVTMGGLKLGLIKFPAANLVGKLCYASIGKIDHLSTFTKNKKRVLTPDIIRKYLPARPNSAHKGTFGTAYVIAGSFNYTGAALLAGFAAYRIGAGLVTMCVPAPLHPILAGQFPEATWLLLPNKEGVITAEAAEVVGQNISRANATLIGPGLNLEETTGEFLRNFITKNLPSDEAKDGENLRLVVDADGLKLLAQISEWEKQIPKETILTPHPGEMAILCGETVEDIQANRIEMATKYAALWGCIIVLKGAYTIIADPYGQIAVVPVATAALAKAGTGDVLAGLITGLRAQGVAGFSAACAGAWIHANAGLLAADRIGNTASVLASDVLNAVPQVISDLIK